MKLFRLSPQQRRLWRLGAESAVYRSQCALLLEGALDGVRLREAVRRATERHEILRTTFQVADRILPLQSVTDVRDPLWREVELITENDLEGLREQERGASLDLAAGPLLRACLARLGGERHVLLLTLPALCADLRSLENLAVEVVRCYGSGEPPAAAVQYAKVAEWQNQMLEEEEGRTYWPSLELDSLQPLELPLARRPTDGAVFEPDSVALPLTGDLGERIEAAAARAGVAVDELLLGLWQVLLWRLTGQRELAAGVAFDGRDFDPLQEVIGPLARFLPLRIRLDARSGLCKLLRDLEAAGGEARQWQESFDLDGELPVLFEFHEQAPVLEVASLHVSPLEPYCCGERFHVKLTCLRTGGRLAMRLHYDVRRLDAASAWRLAGSYECLLRAGLDDLDAPLCELEVLGQAERAALAAFNATRRELPGALTVVELFEEQARRSPDRPALVCDSTRLTYAELNERANRLAQRLRRLGVEPEVKVGLYLDRSPEMVTSIWGVLKAGGAYVPADPVLPPRRTAAMFKSAGVKLVVASKEIPDDVLPARVPTVLVGEVADTPGESAPACAPVFDDRSLAYVLFTSGSTGAPKEVGIEHRQLLNYVRAVSERLDLPVGARFAMVSTFAADLGNTAFFPTLCTGGCLHLVPYRTASDPEGLAEEFARVGTDCLKIVPSHLSALLGAVRPERLLPRSLLVLGGEALNWELVEKVRALAPECRILNHYGPTETTVGVLTFPVDGRVPFASTVPLGRPLANTQIHLLDEALHPVPTGVPGEIYIGGANLARGYLGAPEMTAVRFLPDPFSGRAGMRLYRTGDRARFLPDGSLEFLGRADQQVKIRGFRVEPGEVEARIRAHPEVRDVVVVARRDSSGGDHLVAYVVATKRRPMEAAGERLHALPNGLEVAHLNQNETVHLYRQIFEDQIYLRHGIDLDDRSCVFDVGANIGLFSLFVHRRCAEPEVFAFEPSPVTFEKLRANVERYNLGARLYNCGLSDRAGTAAFTFYPRVSIMSGFHADAGEEELLFRNFMATQERAGEPGAWLLRGQADELIAGRFEGQRFACELKTVSGVIRECGVERIDLLKVDVEKSEWEVFSGIEEEHWGCIRQVTVEVHDVDGRVARMTELLEGHGFEVVAEQDSTLGATGIVHLYAGRELSARRLARPSAAASKRLPSALQPTLSADDLREFLRADLAEHMLPAIFVFLAELPLTGNGKIDRGALPDPEEALRPPGKSVAAPRTPNERLLAQIWEEVLGLESVGIHDNFFALGGDSILSIQVTAKASRAGLRLATRQIFQHQTIAELAAVAVVEERLAAAEGPAVGPVPLTPIQRWFLELDLPDPHHFNQAVLLEVQLRAELLLEVVRRLVEHHDALRLRFFRNGRDWRQEDTAPDSSAPFSRIDLSGVDPATQPARIEQAVGAIQASLDLAAGPIVRAVLFDLGPVRSGRLLVVVHHLAMDGVSWRILLEDLQRVYEQLQRGELVALPPRTTPFKRWAERLEEHVRSGALDGELPYWSAVQAPDLPALPVDFAGGENTVAVAQRVAVSLAEDETAALLQEAPQAYRTQINDLLLTALAQAFAQWTGEDRLLLDLEGHGREEIFSDVDLSRTVGWFTTHFPVLLDLRGAPGPGEALQTIKEELRCIPGRGIGFGLLRYLSPHGDELAALPQPQAKFNYLGQADQALPKSQDSGFLGLAAESLDPVRAVCGTRSHLIEIEGLVLEHRLQVVWTYGADVYRRETVEGLAQSFLLALRSLVAHCLSPGTVDCTPSDFPLAALAQEDLDQVFLEVNFQERDFA